MLLLSTLAVRLVKPTDLAGLMALQERYFVSNLPPADRGDDFLLVLHGRKCLLARIRQAEIHVADAAGAVAGFISLIPAPPPGDFGLDPITPFPLDLADVAKFRVSPIALQRWVIRGPVLIDRAVRGQGVYAAFHRVTQAAYRCRCDVGVIIVAGDNLRSLHASTTKLGAQSLAEVDVEGRRYHFLAYSCNASADSAGRWRSRRCSRDAHPSATCEGGANPSEEVVCPTVDTLQLMPSREPCSQRSQWIMSKDTFQHWFASITGHATPRPWQRDPAMRFRSLLEGRCSRGWTQ